VLFLQVAKSLPTIISSFLAIGLSTIACLAFWPYLRGKENW
jgi:hypothetical protein